MEKLFSGKVSSKKIKKKYLKSIYNKEKYGQFLLGENTTKIIHLDPKLLLFTLSRYKFVAKMLSGKTNVLEIGCQEGFGSILVAKEVGHLHCTDFYIPYIESCKKRIRQKNISFEPYDILDGPHGGCDYDGIYALDVFEHIEREAENSFLENIVNSLNKSGVLILGIPSLESQSYASRASKIGHVNCKSGIDFKKSISRYFENVFLFSMNDEVLHTGFYPMSHYLIAVGVNPLQKNI